MCGEVFGAMGYCVVTEDRGVVRIIPQARQPNDMKNKRGKLYVYTHLGAWAVKPVVATLRCGP